MAKYGNGTNYAKTIDPSSENIIDPGLVGGKIRVMNDIATVTATTTLKSTNYFIVGGKLPTGSQVVQVIVGSENVALATSSTIQVGDEGDPNRYITSVMATANAVHTSNVSTGMYYTVTGTTDNYIRIAGTGEDCEVSSGAINISIMYTVE